MSQTDQVYKIMANVFAITPLTKDGIKFTQALNVFANRGLHVRPATINDAGYTSAALTAVVVEEVNNASRRATTYLTSDTYANTLTAIGTNAVALTVLARDDFKWRGTTFSFFTRTGLTVRPATAAESATYPGALSVVTIEEVLQNSRRAVVYICSNVYATLVTAIG